MKLKLDQNCNGNTQQTKNMFEKKRGYCNKNPSMRLNYVRRESYKEIMAKHLIA